MNILYVLIVCTPHVHTYLGAHKYFIAPLKCLSASKQEMLNADDGECRKSAASQAGEQLTDKSTRKKSIGRWTEMSLYQWEPMQSKFESQLHNMNKCILHDKNRSALTPTLPLCSAVYT